MDGSIIPADDPDGLVAHAEALAQQGRLADAQAMYHRALPSLRAAGGGKLVRALGGLSWALNAAGLAEDALDAAEAALAAQRVVAPGDNAALAILHGLAGNSLMALRRFGRAQSCYAEALRARDAAGTGDLQRAETLNLLGEAAFRQNDFGVAVRHQRAAIAALRRAGAVNQLAPALTSFGVSLFRLGRQIEAEAALREALEVDPDLLLAAENLVHVLYHQDRVTEGKALASEKYRRHSFTVQPRPPGATATLLLLWSLDGTVPHRHLLDGAPFGLIDWHIAFADATHEARLPPHDLVLNLIGDADDGAEALKAAISFQDRAAVPVLNDPRRIAGTARHSIATLLAGIEGLVIPTVAQIPAAALKHGAALQVLAARGLALPVLLRSAGKHGGETAQRIDTAEALGHAVAGIADGTTTYVTAYHDYRSADGYFRKYRAIFVDRKPLPYHLAISPNWLVHYFSADMLDHPKKRAEELQYLQDMPAALGDTAMRALAEIGARMDLDYCGIDFSRLPDGRILLFECNATMLVHPEQEGSVLAEKNPYVRRIITAFQDHLLSRLRRPAAAGEQLP
jgi:tetratricopeptide (TPR) repeat protein